MSISLLGGQWRGIIIISCLYLYLLSHVCKSSNVIVLQFCWKQYAFKLYPTMFQLLSKICWLFLSVTFYCSECVQNSEFTITNIASCILFMLRFIGSIESHSIIIQIYEATGCIAYENFPKATVS